MAAFSIDDPRNIQKEAPYTFFLPQPELLSALAPGDWVKAIFRDQAEGGKFNAERMWVRIETIEDGLIRGPLDNDPADMQGLELGTPTELPLTHVISISWAEGHEPPAVPDRREYWERCLVDDCVLSGRSLADYLYREEPETIREGDEFEDSGWRIRGTEEAVEEDRALNRKPRFVALGAVLNRDDRWLSLIDREWPCAFSWNPGAGCYEEWPRET